MLDFEIFSLEHFLFAVKTGLLISLFFLCMMLAMRYLSKHQQRKGNVENAEKLKEMSDNLWNFVVKIGTFFERIFEKKDK